MEKRSNQMTKKILALILAAVMVFSLAACGKSGKTPEVEQITVGTTAAIEKAVIQPSYIYLT